MSNTTDWQRYLLGNPARDAARKAGLLCKVNLIHPDKSESPCILLSTHMETDSDHVDEHGHTAKVLVSQATIREVAALQEYDDRQRELAQQREQAEKLVSRRLCELAAILEDSPGSRDYVARELRHLAGRME